MNLDPLADKLVQYSPYNYALNNPILFADPDGKFPIIIHVRSFAPYKSFAARIWQGDNRGFSTSKSVTSRLSQATNYETDTKKSTTTALGSLSLSAYGVYAYSEAELNDYSNNNKISTHLYGNDDAVIKGLDSTILEDLQSPDIDLHTNLDISVSKADKDGLQTLSITGTLSGDGFPAGESFVEDSEGNSVFIGTSQAKFGPNEGPFFALFGDSERVKVSVGVEIMVNKNGVFTGVKQGDKTISIADWNKQFTNQNTQGTDYRTSQGPKDINRFGE